MKFLNNIDLNGNQLLSPVIHTSSQSTITNGPAGDTSGTEGQIFYNSHSNGKALFFRDNTAWRPIGDISGVTAGNGLSGGGTGGTVSLAVDFSDFSTVTPTSGDFLATLDSDGANEQKTSTDNLATLFAGAGLTASSAVLSVDAAQSNITSLGTLTALDVDNINLNLKTITITGDTSDTFTIVTGAAGATTLTTTDAAAAAGHFEIAADGDIILDAAGQIKLEPGTSVLWDSLALTGIQASGESFVDDDVSLMTSAAILDKIQAEAGTATNATNVAVTHGDVTDTSCFIPFVTAGASANYGLKTEDGLAYDATNNNLTTSILTANSLDIDSGGADINGTLECNTLTVGGTNVLTGSLITTLGTISAGVWNGTAIASSYIAADAITGAKIADNAIDSEHYTDGSIDNAHIADDAIDSEHYADGSIDNAHIADDAIDSEHYAAGSIDTAHIADDQITLAKMAGLASTKFILGNGSGNPAAVSMSGDATMSNTGAVTITQSAGDFTVTGDLTVSGDTTTVNTATITVEDPLIKLASGNNAADAVDIGLFGLYDTSGSQDLYGGLFRDANDSGKWKLFKDSQTDPGTGTTINTSATGYAVATLVADLEGDVTGNADTATNLTASTSVAVQLGTIELGHASDTTIARSGSGDITIEGNAVYRAGGTDVPVADGGTGRSTLTSGYALLGNGTGTVQMINSTADSTLLVGNGSTMVAETGATLRTSIGCNPVTGSSSITTLGTIATGTWEATDVAVAHGGTGASSASAARTNLGVAYASDAEALAGSSDTVVVTPGNLAARSYVASIGDGSETDYAVTHSLNSRDVIVQLYDVSSYDTVMADVVRTTVDVVTVSFASAPTSNDVRILVTKVD